MVTGLGSFSPGTGRVRWGAPSTIFFVSGEYYLGTLVVRYQLTQELAETGAQSGTTSQRRGGGRSTRP